MWHRLVHFSILQLQFPAGLFWGHTIGLNFISESFTAANHRIVILGNEYLLGSYSLQMRQDAKIPTSESNSFRMGRMLTPLALLTSPLMLFLNASHVSLW